MGPPAKLSYRSAIHKKVFFWAGSVWTLPQIQGEVGGDQEPPGDTLGNFKKFKKFTNKSGSPYMILVSIIIFGGIGCLQEAPDIQIRMNREGSEYFYLLKPYMDYHFC